jgi:DNA-binding NtrC family response regulator
MLAAQLRQTGYEVVESASRQEGIELLRRMQFRAGLVELSGKEEASSLPGGQGRSVAGKKTPEAVSITGSSEPIQALRRMVDRLAPTELALLVSGEHGTGKRHVAQAIHQASARRNLSLVSLDAGSFPESRLESLLFGSPAAAGARGKAGLLGLPNVGTLYLGSIDALSLPLQRRLLVAMEEGTYQSPGDAQTHEFPARLVCGTSRSLSQAVDQGQVLYDLYSRLSLYELRIPPLRARVEDIPLLWSSLLERLCRASGREVPIVELDAQGALLESPWPGNVRELGNVLERTLSLLDGPVIRLSDLPSGPYRTIRKVENLKEARQRSELEHLRQVLVRCGGDKRKAAELLGVNLSTLYRMLRTPRRDQPGAG